MKRWDGSYDELKAVVASAGFAGEWRDLGNGQIQYRTKSGAVLNWWEQRGTILFQGPADAKDAFADAVSSAATPPDAATPRPADAKGQGRGRKREKARVFVVHGHDTVAREQLEWLLMKLDLEPYVLQNTTGAGKTIIEALEQQIGKVPEAEFGIVLMTPDDVGHKKSETEADAKPRARQNVILEMGMLMSSLTRERVAILVKGHVERPTDIEGIIYIPFNDHVKETLPKLAMHLRTAGFTVDTGRVT